MFRRTVDEDLKRGVFDVNYLGWKACQGLYGRQFTAPIVSELLSNAAKDSEAEKFHSKGLHLRLTKRDLKVYQVNTNDGQRVKCSTCLLSDIAYVSQSERPNDDVITFILLGSHPNSESQVHAHVYRCASPERARTLLEELNHYMEKPEQRRRLEEIETDLLNKKAIRASGLLTAAPLPEGAEEGQGVASFARITSLARADDGCRVTPEIGHKINCLKAELKGRLAVTKQESDEEEPYTPPPDYD